MHKPSIQPAVKLEIAGEEYLLVFEFEAISDAEEVSGLALITGLTRKDLTTPRILLVRAMLYGALRAHHGGLGWLVVKKMVTKDNINEIWGKVLEAWVASMAEQDGGEGENPPKAQS